MEILFLIVGSWIAITLTVCAWFLYLMITTPVDRDEDAVKKEPRIECGATGGPGPGGDDNYTDPWII